MKKKEYAMYKGDNLLVIGTARECAEFLGVKPSTIYWYSNAQAKERNKTGNRIIAERI